MSDTCEQSGVSVSTEGIGSFLFGQSCEWEVKGHNITNVLGCYFQHIVGLQQEITLGAKRPNAGLAAKAEPELLFLLAHDQSTPAELRVAAAERAASLNIIAGDDLARAYREAAQALPNNLQSGPALRARLFAAFESAPSVKIRAESIAALLASAHE